MKMKSIIKLILIPGLALILSLPSMSLQGDTSAKPEAQKKQTPPPGSAPKSFSVPEKQTFSLPNGLKVTMVPYGTLPKVAIAVVIRSGSLNEAPTQVSLSEITGQLMKDGGTTNRPAKQVAEEAAAMGGGIDIFPGPDSTQVFADLLSEFAPKMVALMADVVQHPLLPESELPRIKQDALRNLAISKSQSQPLARERFMKTLYPDHPYGRVFPTEEMINKFSVADAQTFYKTNYGAARTHIYVAGKFEAAAVKKAITDAFSGWAKGPDPLVNPPKPSTKRSLEVIDRPNAAQSTLYMGLPTIDPSNPDYIPLQVMNTLLGGTFGSRITSNIREAKGYTYSPFGTLSARYKDAYWAEIADVTTAVTGPSIKEILYEVDRLRKEPPAAAELQGMKDYMAGIFVLRNSSRQGIISQLAYIDLHQLGDDYLSKYVQSVYAVTPEQVQQMAQKYLDSSKMTIVVVGDKSKIADQLAPYQVGGQ
jgi:predicted Zn-dependent peptidase